MKPKKTPKARQDNAPLDEVRQLLKTHAVSLEPITNQVSALPTESHLEYYFVPLEFMKEYKPYHRANKAPYKNLKLVNYNQPAISLSFFSKHKYTIKRESEPDSILLHLKNYRDDLLNNSLFKQLDPEQEKELVRVDELFRTFRNDPNAYQTCFSNYHHYYRYWYCAFRYFEDSTEIKAETASAHLLKHTERIKGQVHERLNVIFIDPKYITRPVPNDNKRIDRELDTYPIQFKLGVTTLYIRKN